MESAIVFNTIEKFVEQIAEEMGNFVQDEKNDYGEESESQCVDMHVEDEIEISFTITIYQYIHKVVL